MSMHNFKTAQRVAPRSCAPHRQQGVSLIEVLVAMLLVAFGMAAMAGMLVYSVNANTNSGNRAMATMMAMEYAEQLRANPNELSQSSPAYARNDTNTYSNLYKAGGRTPPSIGIQCEYPACTSTSLATLEKAEFLKRLKLTLPAGDFVLNKVSNTQADLWILWMENSGATNNKANEGGLDGCPGSVTSIDAANRPRCLYMRVTL